MRLQDRVAIITGGASGIGKATAQLFVEEGARVAIFDLWEDGGRATAEEMNKEHGRGAMFVRCDVAKEAEVVAGVQQVVEAFGKIDILYNNAGGGVSPGDPPQGRSSRAVAIDELSEELWDKTVDSHLKGCFLCSKHVVKQFKKQGQGGNVVSTASMAGLVGLRFVQAYCASKHGIVGLTKAMALELVDHGIRVNAVAPGAIDTYMLRGGLPELPKDQLEDIQRRYPMKRPGQPMDIAHGVLYLVSDEARFVTGTVLSIDGGYVAQ